MKTPGERLAYYIDYKGFTKIEFCETADLVYNNFIRVLSGKRPLGINVLNSIKSALPNLNVNWLLYEEGFPEIGLEANTVREAGETYQKITIEAIVKSIVHEEMDKKMKVMSKQIDTLMTRNNKKNDA